MPPARVTATDARSSRLLQCIVEKEWLNDEVLNLYMELLRKQSVADAMAAKKRSPSCGARSSYFFSVSHAPSFCYSHAMSLTRRAARSCAFQTWFLTKLCVNGYTYKNVERFTVKRDNTEKCDVFKEELLLMPLHIKDQHWGLVCVFVQKRRIVYYDSTPVPLLHGRMLLNLGKPHRREVLFRRSLNGRLFSCLTGWTSGRRIVFYDSTPVPLLHGRMLLNLGKPNRREVLPPNGFAGA